MSYVEGIPVDSGKVGDSGNSTQYSVSIFWTRSTTLFSPLLETNITSDKTLHKHICKSLHIHIFQACLQNLFKYQTMMRDGAAHVCGPLRQENSPQRSHGPGLSRML